MDPMSDLVAALDHWHRQIERSAVTLAAEANKLKDLMLLQAAEAKQGTKSGVAACQRCSDRLSGDNTAR
jgi:hypothetical protein